MSPDARATPHACLISGGRSTLHAALATPLENQSVASPSESPPSAIGRDHVPANCDGGPDMMTQSTPSGAGNGKQCGSCCERGSHECEESPRWSAFVGSAHVAASWHRRRRFDGLPRACRTRQAHLANNPADREGGGGRGRRLAPVCFLFRRVLRVDLRRDWMYEGHVRIVSAFCASCWCKAPSTAQIASLRRPYRARGLKLRGPVGDLSLIVCRTLHDLAARTARHSGALALCAID